jgi:capsular exopolysaccharide synthesis family protein
MSERGEGTPPGLRSPSSFQLQADQPIEVRRSLDALRRARGVIALVVIATTAAVVAVSLYLPKTYRSIAKIVYQPATSVFASTDVSTVQRNLETFQRLLTTREVLSLAAQRIPGENADTLSTDVSGSVDQSADIISVYALAPKAQRSALIANSVAAAFLQKHQQDAKAQLEAAQAALSAQLRAAVARGASVQELDALRQQQATLATELATAGSDLSIVPAEAPDAPYTPRPVRNGVLAFFAALFLGIIAALARDRLVPRVGNPREVSRLLNLPLLVGVPFVSRRFGRRPKLLRAVANEAYQTLQASIRFHLPATKQQVILVTSSVEGEGKTSVAAGLARSLARVGEKTLLISGDLRFPSLHELFKTPLAPGLSDILVAASSNGARPGTLTEAIDESVVTVFGGVGDNLHVIPSGTRVPDPAKLLFSDALSAFFHDLETRDYKYVIVDGPPLLGIADSHALAQRVDSTIVVSRLDRATVEDLTELRDVLERLEVHSLGVVVVGARRSIAYAYAGASTMRDELPRGRVPAQLASHRPRPDQPGEDPEVTPVQRVDERAVGDEAAPGS